MLTILQGSGDLSVRQFDEAGRSRVKVEAKSSKDRAIEDNEIGQL